MSSFEALALLVVTWMSSLYVLVVTLGKTLAITSIVQTGLVDGVPVSIEYRRRLIWYWYFGVSLGVLIAFPVVMLVLVQIGMRVDDPKLQNLMYLFASLAGVGAVGWALGVVSQMSYHLKLLRKEEGN